MGQLNLCAERLRTMNSMFRISYRLVDPDRLWSTYGHEQLDTEGDPAGFFKIDGNSGTSYGYHHSAPLAPGEEGLSLILVWAELLTWSATSVLRGHYALIRDPDSHLYAIEFEAEKDGRVHLRSIAAPPTQNPTPRRAGEPPPLRTTDQTFGTFTKRELVGEIARSSLALASELEHANPNCLRWDRLDALRTKTTALMHMVGP